MPEDFSVAELSKALERSADDFKRHVSVLIDAAPHALVARLQSAYPVGPAKSVGGRTVPGGTLRRRISITSGPSKGDVPSKRVRATAPHIHMWQEGTVQRQDSTRRNANRGRMPVGGPVFERNAGQVRREMLQRAEQELTRTHEL